MSDTVPPHTRPAPGGYAEGPVLWTPMYFALALQGAMLAVGIYLPMNGFEWFLGGFPLLFVAAALAALALRDLLHDWYVSLPLGARLRVLLVIAAAFCIPAFMRDHSIIPEGFVFAAPVLLLLCFGYSMAQFFLVFTSVGFWATLPRWGPLEVPAAIAFGVVTLWGFAAAHFAFVGAPFGLRGWWGVRKPLGAALLHAIPAGAAAWMISAFWPDDASGLTYRTGRTPVPPVSMADALRTMSGVDWRDLVIQLVKLIGVLALSFILLAWLRKYMARRVPPPSLPRILGGDVSTLEYTLNEPEPGRPGLEGVRAEIVFHWRRWERRAADQGFARKPSETVREHALRVEEKTGPAPARSELVRIMEAAHYAAKEPASAESHRMKTLVDQEIQALAALQKKSRQ